MRTLDDIKAELGIEDATALRQEVERLRAELAEAKSLPDEAHIMQWKHDSVYAEWRERIKAFMEKRK